MTPARDRLRERMRRVPRAILNGGSQAAANYKEWIVAAEKKAKNPRTTDREIESLIAHYDKLNQERLI